MKILAIDSSGMSASVALAQEGKLVAEYTVNDQRTHSQTLLPMLEELRNALKLDLETVDAIALANGPGSFTGLRIGSATAKGLGLALGKPLIEVPTLEGLAWNAWGSRDLVCPMMDARRGQVYTAVYRFADDPLPQVCLPQSALEVGALAEDLNQFGEPVFLLGDGAQVYREELQSALQVPYRFAPPHQNAQRAGAVACCAFGYAALGRFVEADASKPEYLRVSQAERELTEKLAQCQIRPMRREDAPEVAGIEEQLFTQPWSAQGFLDALKQKDSRYLVAAYQGHVIAYCGLLRSFDTAEITNVAVAKRFQKCGVAKRMLRQLLSDLEQEGVGHFTLEVRKSNAGAIHLYESLGFATEGIRPSFYEKPREDALIMWKRELGND